MELEGLQHSETMNEQQLREIMSRYGEDIWNYIYYLTKNSEQADDLAQEVFIKCYYRIGTYRGNSSFKAWLLTIAIILFFRTGNRAFFVRAYGVVYSHCPRLMWSSGKKLSNLLA